MSPTKILIFLLLFFNLTFANSKITLNNMYITNFINIVVNNIDKNIMLNANLDGELNFQLKNKLTKKDLYPLLIDILETRGYKIEETNLGYLELIAIREINENSNKLITEIIEVKPETIEEGTSKVKHLLSKDGEMSEYSENLKTIKKTHRLCTK